MDLISRQAAIEEAEKKSNVDGAYGYMDTKSIVDMLDALPSVQPDLQEYSVWFRIGETLVDVSKMHITAEEGIEKIRSYLMRMKKPERKHGKWVRNVIMGMEYVYCSECEDTNWPLPLDVNMNYCPNCGAEMEGEEDE